VLLVTGVFGVVVVVLVLTDAVTTTVNVSEQPGVFADRVVQLSRRPLRALFRRTRRPSVALGQVVLLIVVWTTLLWLGWWLILLTEPARFVHTTTGATADALDTLYVAGFAVFALGVGDIGPTSRAAQLLLPLASVTGLGLVTLEITYLLSLTRAAAHKRQVARMLHNLGDDADQIVAHLWDGTSFAHAPTILNPLATEMALLAEHQLAFPVLYEFGARRRELAVAPGLVRLLDALVVMHDRAAPQHRLPSVTHHQLLTSMQELVLATPLEGRDVTEAAPPGTRILERLGIPVVETPNDEVSRELRRALHRLAVEEGWPMADDDADDGS
jgi:hypothetical protein